MKKTIEQIFNSLQKESLTKRERDVLYKKIEETMNANPLFSKPVSSPYAWFVVFRQHAFAVAMVVVLVFGSGGSIFAEQALPGDIFYSIKTGFNEEIRGWFANSSDEQAEWQLFLAERRLEEIETLSQESRLSTDLQEVLSAEVEFHTKQVLGEDLANFSGEPLKESSMGRSKKTSESMDMGPEEATNVEATLMMATVLAEDTAVMETEEGVAVSISDVKQLLETVNLYKKEIRQSREKTKDKKLFLKEWGRTLFAEKLLFEANTAISIGDLSLANDLFERAKAILPTTLDILSAPEDLTDTSIDIDLPISDASDQEDSRALELDMPIKTGL